MFKKLILTTNPVTEGPATALIEVGGDANDVAITTLDGEYRAVEEFGVALKEAAREEAVSAADRDEDADIIYNFFPMTLPDARALITALTEAVEAAQK